MRQIVTHQVKGLALFAALTCAAGLAWADSPHFIDSKTRASLQSDGDLEVQFKEAGLGDAETSYLLSANASSLCTCVTNSGMCPKAANKVAFQSAVSAQGTFSPKNGNVVATLVASAPACPVSSPPTCGTGQTLELSEIAYTGISLQDTTNGVSAGGLPTQLSATFFQCP
jgi:Tfp pilus assembly protein PilX